MEDFDITHEITLGGNGAVNSGRQLAVGDVIGGSYRLKSLLGQGGMGYVFCVEHTTFARDYALKMLAPELLTAETRNRFVNEGRAIAALNHPNIVKVYDMALDGGTYPFYVMDLLSGKSLAEYTRKGNIFSFEQWLDIFCQIVDGFAYAHSKGIVHRDIKPSNIILLPQNSSVGLVKIVDFGIAKMLDTSGFEQQSQTATGMIFGSPYYMSPEQCIGGTIDARSDIYSAGCTFFELLSDRPPFAGENALATVMMHQNQIAPVLSTTCPWKTIPASFDQVIAKMLAKKPSERYRSMSELRHDLERVKEGKTIGKFASDIDSDVDDGFEEASSEDEPSVATGRLGLSAKIVVPLMVLTFVVGLSGAVYMLSHKPPVERMPDKAKTVSFIPPLEGIGEKSFAGSKFKFEQDSEIDWKKTDKDYNACKKIYSTKTRQNGKVTTTFFFPQSALGKVCMDYNDGQTAVGKVIFQGAGPFQLQSRSPDFAAIERPEIFQKIGPNEFSGLELIGVGRSQKNSEHLARILETVAKWPYLEQINLFAFDITDDVIKALTKLDGINTIKIKSADWSTKLSGNAQFWHHLNALRLSHIDHAEYPLQYLRGSKKLNFVQLDELNVPTHELAMLDSCPNFCQIQLSGIPMSDDLIECLGKLKRLVKVQIDNCELTEAQVRRLLSYRNLENIELRDLDMSPETLDTYSRMDRRITVINK